MNFLDIKLTNFNEAKLGSVFSEASSAEHETILANNTVMVSTAAAG